MLPSLLVILGLWLLLQNEASYRGTIVLVDAAPSQRLPGLVTPSLFSFLSFGRRKRDQEEKQVLQGILADYELQVRELQILIFGLKTENGRLLNQLEGSKQTIQTLRKEKTAIQQSLKHDINSIKAGYEKEISEIKSEHQRRTQELVEKEKRLIKESLEKEKQAAIDELKITHKIEIDSKIEEINVLKSKYQQSTATIEDLKKECLEKSNQLNNLHSESEKRESDYVKSVEELRQQLRARSLESKQPIPTSKISQSNSPSSPSSTILPSSSSSKITKEKPTHPATKTQIVPPPHSKKEKESIVTRRSKKKTTSTLSSKNDSDNASSMKSFVTNTPSKSGRRR